MNVLSMLYAPLTLGEHNQALHTRPSSLNFSMTLVLPRGKGLNLRLGLKTSDAN